MMIPRPLQYKAGLICKNYPAQKAGGAGPAQLA